MASKKNSSYMKSTGFALLISNIIYSIIAILAVYMYGSSIEPNVMQNINADGKNSGSIILRASFLLVVGCHIPFIFFAGKECLLNMYFELKMRAISRALEYKLKRLSLKESK